MGARDRAGSALRRILLVCAAAATLAAMGCSNSQSPVLMIGPPSQLAFSVQPASAGAGRSITPAIIVSIQDSGGHVVTTATSMVTIAIGTNPGGGALSGTFTVAAVNGLASFTGLSINNSGPGYTLTASATGLTGAMSSAFNVYGAAAQLAFSTQPGGGTGGTAWAQQPAVTVEDASGTPVTNSSVSITLAITSGTGTVGAGLTCTVNPQVPSLGVATFAGCNIDKAGNGYTLTASAAGLTSATSAAFNIIAGAGSQLVFTQQPTTVQAGASITPAVTVAVTDSGGNIVTSATNSIAISFSTNAGAGMLSGTLMQSAVSGVATFADLSINSAAAGYTLLATTTGLPNNTVVSNPFTVTGLAAQLVFTQQPPNSVSPNANFNVQVSVEDASNNLVASATNPITLSILNNPGSPAGTLSGTLTVNAVSGVATFSSLSINNVGNGYTLQAAATGLSSATSHSFNVTNSLPANCAGAPSGFEHLMTGPWAFLVQGWFGSSAGSPFAGIFQVNTNGTDNGGALSANGQFDRQNGADGPNSFQTFTINTSNALGASSYVIGPDSTGSGYVGCMTLAITNNNGGATQLIHYRFSLGGLTGAAATSTTRATKMRIIRWDDTVGTGVRISGVGLPQDSGDLNVGSLQHDYAFGLDGVDVNGGHFAEAGSLDETSTPGTYTLQFDVDDSGAGEMVSGTSGSTASVSAISAITGFGTVTSTVPGAQSNGAVLIVNKNELFFLSASPYVSGASGGPLLSGREIVTGAQGSHSAISGNFMIHLTGISVNGCNNGVANYNCSDVQLVLVKASTTGAQTSNVNGITYQYRNGATVTPRTFGPLVFTVDATWSRAVVTSGGTQVQAPVFYFATPVTSGSDQTEPFMGFGAGSGPAGGVDPTAGFGFIETAASSNLSTSSLQGNYFAGTEDPGDNNSSDEVDVVSASSSGALNGSGFKVDSSGLSTSTISGQSINVTNADPTVASDTFPGLFDFVGGGSTVLGVTNGTRLVFFDTGGEAKFIVVDKQ